MRILEKLKEQGFTGEYSIVKHYIRGKKEQLDEKATVRFETMPGLQGQMDWAFFEDHAVMEDGKPKKLYCFLLILGYSRLTPETSLRNPETAAAAQGRICTSR